MNDSFDTREDSHRPNFTGSLKRNIAGLIDAALVLLIFFAANFYMPPAWSTFLYQSVRPELYIIFLLILYRFISFLYFDRTIGMKLCSIIYLNDEEEKASVKEKLFAAFFILINGTSNYEL